jgi:hypothetical protein
VVMSYDTFPLPKLYAGGLGVIVVIYAVLSLFKYRLNHKHMKYQYYSDISPNTA